MFWVTIRFPPGSFAVGAATNITAQLTGNLGDMACSDPVTLNASLNDTIPAPYTYPQGAGCSASISINPDNNPWGAVFKGKSGNIQTLIQNANPGNTDFYNSEYEFQLDTNAMDAYRVNLYGNADSLRARVYYKTKNNPTYSLLTTMSNQVNNYTNLPLLGVGYYFTCIKFVTDTLPPGSYIYYNTSFHQLSPLRDGNTVNAKPLKSFVWDNSCGAFTCMNVKVITKVEYPAGTIFKRDTCNTSKVIVEPYAGIFGLSKYANLSGPYLPDQIIPYHVQFAAYTEGDSIDNFIMRDTLPNEFQYIPGSMTINTGGNPNPVFTVVGQVLQWSWAANSFPDNKISTTATFYIDYQVRVKAGTPAGTYTNCVFAIGDNIISGGYSQNDTSGTGRVCADLPVSTAAQMKTIKWVKGACDTTY